MPRQRLSRGDLLLLAALLAAAGVAVSAFLTWQYYTGEASGVCDVNSFWNCTVVRQSPWSSFGGIPTSAAGLGGFVVLLALAVLGLRGIELPGPWSTDAWLLGFAVLGALIGLGLTYLELFVIGAVCIFCATGFAMDLGVLAVAVGLRRSSRRADVG